MMRMRSQCTQHFWWKKRVAMWRAAAGMVQPDFMARARSIMNCVFYEARCCCRGRVSPNYALGCDVSLVAIAYGSGESVMCVTYKVGGWLIKERQAMLENLMAACGGVQGCAEGRGVVVLQEEPFQSTDFLLVGLLQHHLAHEKSVTLVTFRQNYAHYLALSKKLHKSIEPSLKSGKLKYIECFQHPYSGGELPLTEMHPSTFVPPPGKVRRVSADSLFQEQWEGLVETNGVLAIDAVQFATRPDLVMGLAETALLAGSGVILGGCSGSTGLGRVLKGESSWVLAVDSDVGGYGRVAIEGQDKKSQVLWRFQNNTLSFSQQVAL